MQWMDSVNSILNFLGISPNVFWAIMLGFPVLLLLLAFVRRGDSR